MASNHYTTKRHRRPKNKRRKDYTRDTMLKLRELRELRPLTVQDFCSVFKPHSFQPVNGMFTYRSALNQINGGTNGQA